MKVGMAVFLCWEGVSKKHHHSGIVEHEKSADLGSAAKMANVEAVLPTATVAVTVLS